MDEVEGYVPFDKIENLLLKYKGIMNSFVTVENQYCSRSGDLFETILIKLWVNEDFDAYNVMETLASGFSLQKRIETICGELSTPKLDIIYI